MSVLLAAVFRDLLRQAGGRDVRINQADGVRGVLRDVSRLARNNAACRQVLLRLTSAGSSLWKAVARESRLGEEGQRDLLKGLNNIYSSREVSEMVVRDRIGKELGMGVCDTEGDFERAFRKLMGSDTGRLKGIQERLSEMGHEVSRELSARAVRVISARERPVVEAEKKVEEELGEYKFVHLSGQGGGVPNLSKLSSKELKEMLKENAEFKEETKRLLVYYRAKLKEKFDRQLFVKIQEMEKNLRQGEVYNNKLKASLMKAKDREYGNMLDAMPRLEKQMQNRQTGKPVGGKEDVIEALWDHRLTSGPRSVKGKTIGELWEKGRGAMLANLVEGEFRKKLSGADQRKLDELMRVSQPFKEYVDKYWRINHNARLSPEDAKRAGGFSQQDTERVSRDRDPEETDTTPESGGALKGRKRPVMMRAEKYRKEFVDGRWVRVENPNAGRMVENPSAPGRDVAMEKRQGEWDPEKWEAELRAEVKRDFFRGLWDRSMEEARVESRWKPVRKGVWKRWNDARGEYEYYKGKREPWRGLAEGKMAGYEGNVIGGLQWSMARTLLQMRLERAGVQGVKPTPEEIAEQAGKMEDVVAIEVKRRKLREMAVRGWLDAPRAITGLGRMLMEDGTEREVVLHDEAWWGLREKEAERARRGELAEGASVEGSGAGVQKGKQFRDRVDDDLLRRLEGAETEEERGKVRREMPWWMRAENAESEVELEELHADMVAEFGELGVEEVVYAGGSGLGRVMEDRRKVLQLRRNDLAAQNSA